MCYHVKFGGFVAMSTIAELSTKNFTPWGPITSGDGDPKSKLVVVHPVQTYPENFLPICPQLFELSCTQADK